jgi:hypothetical protein
MIKYYHGSEDSVDTDVLYVFKEIPDKQECIKFCTENPNEDRNIVVIKDGIITDCFMGTPDEINNSLLETYFLHEQEFPLFINRKVKRDILLKEIQVIRGILTILSRSQYRDIIKKALKGSWQERIDCLNQIYFEDVDFDNLNKKQNGKDILKFLTFQIGQVVGLEENQEYYTKKSICSRFPLFKNSIYREEIEKSELIYLTLYKDKFISNLEKHNVLNENNLTVFMNKQGKKINRIFDLIKEKEIKITDYIIDKTK